MSGINEERTTYHKELTDAGLSPNQAKIYETVTRHGRLSASDAARIAGVPRTLGYKALQDLQVLGLIEKEKKPGKSTSFYAVNPLKLKDIVEQRYRKSKAAKVALDGVLGKLISDFNTRSGTPGIRILADISGIEELYEDILNEGQPIKLIRSPLDTQLPEVEQLLNKQIEDQKKLGIKVQLIGPMMENTPERMVLDKENLITRRIVPKEKLAPPAQIIIYANKVAITSYKDVVITTIIENVAIRETFVAVFDYLWESTKEEHGQILKTITAKDAQANG